VERVKLSANLFLPVATVMAVSQAISCSSVPWAVSREVCGKIKLISSGSATILSNAELQLYRSKSKSAPCCLKADKIDDLRTDANGDFKAGRLEAGSYFVVVTNSNPEIAFPVALEKDYDGQSCALNAAFTFDQKTKKTEQTVTIVVHPPN
jgi:hypothetical protein